MSEWQPARIRFVHDREPIRHLVKIKSGVLRRSGLSKIVRVREATQIEAGPHMGLLALLKCDGKRFFCMHPDDSESGLLYIYCEHEILTD